MPNPPPRLVPPHPAPAPRLRTQLESFLVLRRNPLELWGPVAYREDILPGRFLGRQQLLLNAPEGVAQVLVRNAANYRRTLPTRRVLQPLLGNGLFLAEGDAWKHRRRTIAPSLTPRTMPVLARHVLAATEATEADLATRLYQPVELLPRLQHLTLTIAARSMFSLEMDNFGADLRRLLLDYARRFGRVGLADLLLPATMRTPLDRGREAFAVHWRTLLDRILDARAQAPRSDAPRDLFDLLLEARDPETGLPFTQAELRDEVSTMILAGHETTAVTLFWSCFLAASAPEWQDSLHREAAALTDPHAAVTAPKLRAHIDETLRLYPPAFLLVREAINADEILGARVAAGTVISIAPWVLHRHHRRWTDPDRFDPGRFLPGAAPPARYAYLPFGAGPRICVGQHFALTEAALVLSRLLARFRLVLPTGAMVLPRGLVTTQPDRPVRFIVEPRG